MPIGKCSFCGTYVTGGGTAMGKNAVACTACAPLAVKWLAAHPLPVEDEPVEAATEG